MILLKRLVLLKSISENGQLNEVVSFKRYTDKEGLWKSYNENGQLADEVKL